MSARLSSGQPRLDNILGGGLPEGAINMVVGPPGSGKTILAEQYMFHNATPERPGLYLSTVSEPLGKLVRYGQTLSFFEPEAIGSRVIFEDLGDALAQDGLEAAVKRVATLLKERRPGLLVIDSFKARCACSRCSSSAAATFAPAGTPTASASTGCASSRVSARRPKWRITPPSMSGSPPGSPRSTRCSTRAIGAAPPPSPPARREPARRCWDCISSSRAPRSAKPGVIATLQENPIQLERMARGFGWSLAQPNVELMYRSPIDVYLEEWFYDLLETMERTDARRVLVDSLADLRLATTDEVRFREYIYSLLQHCATGGLSLMLTLETSHGGSPEVSDYGVSNLSDNVVLLQIPRRRARVIHTITVLKTRASRHDPAVREFGITDAGIVLGEPMEPDDAA